MIFMLNHESAAISAKATQVNNEPRSFSWQLPSGSSGPTQWKTEPSSYIQYRTVVGSENKGPWLCCRLWINHSLVIIIYHRLLLYFRRYVQMCSSLSLSLSHFFPTNLEFLAISHPVSFIPNWNFWQNLPCWSDSPVNNRGMS